MFRGGDCAGRNTSNYTVVITRLEASEQTDLLGLDVWYGHTPVQVVGNWYNNSGLLFPSFDRGVHTYDMEVEHNTSQVSLNATMADFYSILKVRRSTPHLLFREPGRSSVFRLCLRFARRRRLWAGGHSATLQ